jgi:hypothetical protein
MNTQEYLERIKQKCQEYIDHASENVTDFYGGRAIAGWRATIAAIDALELAKMDTIFQASDGESALSCVDDEVPTEIGRKANHAISLIIAAWPEDLLQ